MTRVGRAQPTLRSQIKLSAVINPQPSAEELLFCANSAYRYCYTWLPDELANYDYLARLTDRVSRAGLKAVQRRQYEPGQVAADPPGNRRPR